MRWTRDSGAGAVRVFPSDSLYYSRPASGKHCCDLVFVYIQSGDERNQLKYIAYVKYICSINYELLFYTEYNPLLLCCQLSCQIFPSPTAGAF